MCLIDGIVTVDYLNEEIYNIFRVDIHLYEKLKNKLSLTLTSIHCQGLFTSMFSWIFVSLHLKLVIFKVNINRIYSANWLNQISSSL